LQERHKGSCGGREESREGKGDMESWAELEIKNM